MLFGTGSHNTTRLCMETLEKIVEKGSRVLDIGCGSGILSILSLILGADFAAAVDIDPAAVHIAYENASYNDIDSEKYFWKTSYPHGLGFCRRQPFFSFIRQL